MRRLDCPIDGCHAAFEAETDDEIMERAAEHAGKRHPDVELDDATATQIRSKILTV